MEGVLGWFKDLLDLFLHIDKHLSVIIAQYGLWTYGLLFSVIFCETGLVILPFLPGDSLLFAAGTFAAKDVLKPHILVLVIAMAAICGDSTNYLIGHFVGPRVFTEKIRFLKKEYLYKTHAFYEKHGGKTIILARFIPIIRTFAPFVAGIGAMNYPKFLLFSVIGSFCWSSIFVYAGYFFGNLEIVKNNFSIVIVAIILISVVPIIIEYLKSRLAKNKA